VAQQNPGDGGIVTIRDVYLLVQQVHTRTTALQQQVSVLTERAEEDRRRTQGQEDEIQSLKIKVYSFSGALLLLSTMLTILSHAARAGVPG
jgi:hypothetical protein